ncbi:MAG: hypothetical protein R2883_00610 [Caldisericia bacterium]
MELFPDKNKIVHRGKHMSTAGFQSVLVPHCETHNGEIAVNIYTIGEILGCNNVHSWDFETKKCSFDTVNLDFFYVNLEDENDSFRRLIFKFDSDIATLHRPIYDNKASKLPFAPYLNREREKFKDPIEMMVPLYSLLDILGFEYHYRPMNNSILINLKTDW